MSGEKVKHNKFSQSNRSPMQKKVLFSLLFISIFGIILSTLVFYVMQTIIAQNSADELSVLRLNDVERRILSNTQKLNELIEIVREDNLARARALSILLEADPGMINDIDKLNEVAAALKVDEIHIIDENGILRWGTQPFKYGMDFSNGEQTRPFLAILEDPSIEIAQVPMPNASLGVTRQYAGVALRHTKGIAEVGVIPERFMEALEDARIGNILHDNVIGRTGYMFSVSVETGLISSHPNQNLIGSELPEGLKDFGFMKVDGKNIRYNTRITPEEILVSAFPTAEMYEQRTFSTFFFLLFTVILFALFCVSINLYLKKTVVAGIQEIIGALDIITAGNLDMTANVRSNAEFDKLSNGINHMLASIKAKIIEVSEAVVAAEEASKAKSSFLAVMSHEIRTPMNGIIGFSELALDSGITQEEKDDYLRKIKASGFSLLQIINDILDISKIESGNVELESIPFDLHDVFSICQTIITPKALEKGITLYCYAEPSFGKKLMGDPTKLRQALLNLMSNSVKFTNTGMIKLLSVIKTSTEGSITMCFEIKDSGIGMTQEQIGKIFEPFKQADASTTRKYGGTGLGLSIAKSNIELMGGKLMVESTLGLGSKFSFELTFKTINDTAEIDTREIFFNELEKPIFKGSVLICEDNEINQKVLADHLARVGLTYEIAVNGQDGVDLVRKKIENNEKPFGLIFMDIHMPVMDGLEASKKLQEIGNKTPIVALTANVMATDKEIYRSHNMPDYVAKPFTTKELWICLYKYFTPICVKRVDKDEENGLSEKRQKRLLTDFARDYQSVYEDITNAVDAGNIKLAHRLAHTLKGLAGLMGKVSLQEASRVIEHSLENGKADYTTNQMNTLERELKTTLDELAYLLDEHEPSVSEPICFDKTKALELFTKLESLLELYSAECVQLVEELRTIPETGVLIKQIEEFEYELALETLASVKNSLGVL